MLYTTNGKRCGGLWIHFYYIGEITINGKDKTEDQIIKLLLNKINSAKDCQNVKIVCYKGRAGKLISIAAENGLKGIKFEKCSIEKENLQIEHKKDGKSRRLYSLAFVECEMSEKDEQMIVDMVKMIGDLTVLDLSDNCFESPDRISSELKDLDFIYFYGNKYGDDKVKEGFRSIDDKICRNVIY